MSNLVAGATRPPCRDGRATRIAGLVAVTRLCYAAAESGLCRIMLPQDRNSATDPAVIHYQVLEHEEAIMGKGNNSQKKETKKPKKDAKKGAKESKK